MDKAKINNEIILMRKNVEQARIHIIKKLTREAVKLRQKKGTEAQKAKNSRKADRLAAEILSVKKIKKDEITKFILKNTLSLEEILQSQDYEPSTRIMARIGNHKYFKTKISEFKSKYPDYINFLGPGRKKKQKLEQQGKSNLEIIKNVYSSSNAENVNSSKDDHAVASIESENDSGDNLNINSVKRLETKNKNTTKLENEDEGDVDSNDEDEDDEEIDDEDDEEKDDEGDDDEKDNEDEDDDEDENQIKNLNENEDCNIIPKLPQNSVVKTKIKTSLPNKQKKVDEDKEKEYNLKSKIPNKKTDSSKIISKQAIVKKFNDILQSDDCNLPTGEENSDFIESNVQVEKEVDSFFVMEDGETNYLSIAPTKSKLTDMEDDYDYKNKFNKQNFSQRNGDFFNTKFRNDSKFNSNKLNSRSEYQQKNKRPYEKEKVGNKKDFKKFNGDYKNNSFKKLPKSNYEDKNNVTLHPSWEAKKKQQEILKQGFQGKKIVFDDNF